MDHPEFVLIDRMYYAHITHSVACFTQGCVVHHGCDHQVDVDPEGVVEHKPYEGQESEDVAHRKACWQLHLYLGPANNADK